MEAADARVAQPAEDQLARHAGADHLVVDDVGRHADERQVATPLADDLVTGGEADEVREALDGDAVTVSHQRRDGIAHAGDLGCAHRLIVASGESRGLAWRPGFALAGQWRERLSEGILEFIGRDGALELGPHQPLGVDDHDVGLGAQAPALRPRCRLQCALFGQQGL